MIRTLAFTLVLLLFSSSVIGADGTFAFGGDQYAAGQHPSIVTPVERDAFMAGRDVSLDVPVEGNAHLAGMNVTSGAPVTGALYAAGFTVNVLAPVTGGLSAAGNSVAIRSPGEIGGNARLAGSSVTIAGPVAGSALVAAQTLALESTVQGDISFYGETISFGPNAKVNGTLAIHAPKPIDVPAGVAPADRVQYTEMAAPNYATEAGGAAAGVVGSFLPILWAAIAWWLLLFIVGVAFIALAPRTVGALDIASRRRPFRNFGLGLLTFASLLGLVPVAAITVVGILLLPVVFLFVAIACGLGYLAGVFFVGLRIANALFTVDTNAKRIGVLAVSLLVAGLLALVPFLNWLVGLVLLAFGLGIIAVAIMDGWAARDAARRPTPPATPEAPAAVG